MSITIFKFQITEDKPEKRKCNSTNTLEYTGNSILVECQLDEGHNGPHNFYRCNIYEGMRIQWWKNQTPTILTKPPYNSKRNYKLCSERQDD